MVSCNKLFTSTIGDTPMTQSTTQSIIALPEGMEITGEIKPGYEQVLTPAALALVARLTRAFEPRRQQLLAARSERARRLDAGERPDFLAETAHIRAGDWKIAPIPPALECRRVQITGQINMIDAVRRTISLEQNGKSYKLNDKIATLVVRPRGWHLDEKHVLVDGQRISGGIFDFALFMFHNAKEQLARGAGPYFYLPKMESHLEARLWNDIFVMTQDELGLPQGTIKATVLIETI